MSKHNKILIVAPYHNNFIDLDGELLASRYLVKYNVYNWKSKALLFFNLLRQFIFLLFNIYKYNKILIHFGGYWSLLPTLFGKLLQRPVFIVIHGTDVASIPELNYGSLRKKLFAFFIQQSFENASKLLPVSSSLIQVTNEFHDFSEKSKKQGLLNHFPHIKTPIKVLTNGIDTDFWSFSPENKESRSIISVFSEEQFYLKGGDLIILIAEKLPEYTFYMVGIDKVFLEKFNPSENIIATGRLDRNELLNVYKKASIHFQLSAFEGFGLSLVEAMSCGCIPVVSSVNSLGDIVGKSGFVLNMHSVEDLYKLVLEIDQIENKSNLRKLARERVVNNYTLDIRQSELFNLMNS